jgi:serine/threonine-protein kinase
MHQRGDTSESMMDAERWRRVRALFDLLVDTPEADWEARLAVACADDAGVRAEALALLRADRVTDTGAVLAEAAPHVVAAIADRIESEDAAASATARAGMRLGPFKLVRQIGRGGMGVVWLGERVAGGFSQAVAIKLVLGSWDSSVAQRRFLLERQILAGLQHPNIAHPIDGGVSADGKPWLALEYVDGENLLAWCDARRLDIGERLRLFLVICAAVAHAHQRLIVHRDLKPSNILVGADGCVKLLDFGIAKMLDRDGGETATRAFTPDYAAPEQLRGEAVTTAVDVYALGLLLYELLSGRRASSDSGGKRETQRPSATATHEEYSGDAVRLAALRGLAPQGLRRRLRGDLDAIVLKALRSEPAKRYAGVAELAADVERHLRNQPVHARRGSWSYRFGRFARRHRWALAASAAGMAALACGLAAALWQAREASRQRDIALREAQTSRRTVDVLVNVFKSADPRIRPGENVTPADLLSEGEREVRRTLGAQPEQRAALLEALGRARLGLGTYAAAEPLLEEALALRVTGSDRLAEASTRLALGAIRSQQSRDAEAVAEAERAWQLSQDASALATELRATADLNAGVGLANLDRWQDAEPRMRRSAAARAALFGVDSEAYAEVLEPLSFNLAVNGRANEAIALLEPAWQAVAARTKTGALERRPLLTSLSNAFTRAGRYMEAVAPQREALAIAERTYGIDHPSYYTSLNNLAVALYSAGEAQESADAFARSIAWRRANPARERTRRPDLDLRGYAMALDAAGRSADAVEVLQQVRDVQRGLEAVTAAERARTWLLLARAQRRAGRHVDAQTSLSTYFDHPHLDASAQAAGLIERNWLSLARGDAGHDCAAAREAEQLRRSGAKPADLLHAQAALAVCWIEIGQRSRAQPLIEALSAPAHPALTPLQREAVDAALARWNGRAARF